MDVFNYHLYNGEQAIKPEELDTVDLTVPYGIDIMSVRKYLDLLKIRNVMMDENVLYVISRVELQNEG